MELSGHSYRHPAVDRRGFLKIAGAGAVSWLTPLGHLLSQQQEQGPKGAPPRSVILLWLQGGPSQLETFDPHPGTNIASGTGAISTARKGVQLATGFEHLAEQMESVSLIRSLVSKEGDHERGTYLGKTGYRPEAGIIHPSLGAVVCHKLPGKRIDVPPHISILPGQWPSRGGFLGDEFDAFKVEDPEQKVPDITPHVALPQLDQRLADLKVVEAAFARGRGDRVKGTHHQDTIARARTMMTSEHIKAFDVSTEPAELRKAYGDNAFGRGCLAARRLIEAGVRCVEVTLDGWDSHANNHSIHKTKVAMLDPAFATLLKDLKKRDLLRHTIVLCMGEFGRTPRMNPAAGRDHWPDNFCAAIAGGGIRAGVVVGETDPEGGKRSDDNPKQPKEVWDVHATVLAALGLDPKETRRAPVVQRPIALSKGEPIRELLA
ncbi:MAG: DUF1501 domain-containing protein [Gemmataceae bacterium]|nr:DUF1501 domain-containing protein [Gemmataceae bacterium]